METTKRAVMEYLSAEAAPETTISITRKRISSETGINLGRLRHGLKALEEEGLLIARRRLAKEGGGYIANEYEITAKGLRYLAEGGDNLVR